MDGEGAAPAQAKRVAPCTDGYSNWKKILMTKCDLGRDRNA